MFVTRAGVKRGSVRGSPGQPMMTSLCVLSGTRSTRRFVVARVTGGYRSSRAFARLGQSPNEQAAAVLTASAVVAPATTSTAPSGAIAALWYARISLGVADRTTPESPIAG